MVATSVATMKQTAFGTKLLMPFTKFLKSALFNFSLILLLCAQCAGKVYFAHSAQESAILRMQKCAQSSFFVEKIYFYIG